MESRLLKMPALSELLGDSIAEGDQLLVLAGYAHGLMAGKTKGLKERNRLPGELIHEGVRFGKLPVSAGLECGAPAPGFAARLRAELGEDKTN